MRDRLVELLLNAPQIPCVKGGRATGLRHQTFENISDHLLANGVIVPPVKVGDTVYFLIEYDDFPELPPGIEAAKVTEVGTRGFFTSAFIPPQDDMGNFTPWSELGKTVFLREEDALPLLKRT